MGANGIQQANEITIKDCMSFKNKLKKIHLNEFFVTCCSKCLYLFKYITCFFFSSFLNKYEFLKVS